MSKISTQKIRIILNILVLVLTVVWFTMLTVNFVSIGITDPGAITASLTQFISISFLMSSASAAGSLVFLLRGRDVPHTLKIFQLVIASVSVFCFYYILTMITLSGDGRLYLWLLLTPALTFFEFVSREQELYLSDTLIAVIPGVIAGCLVVRDTGFLDVSLASAAGAVIIYGLPAMILIALAVTAAVWLSACLIRMIVLPDTDNTGLKRKWMISLLLPVLGILMIDYAGVLFFLYWPGTLLVAAGICTGIANIVQSFNHKAPRTLFIVIPALVFCLISLTAALCFLNATMGSAAGSIIGVALLLYAVPAFGAVLMGTLIAKGALYLRQKRLSGKS